MPPARRAVTLRPARPTSADGVQAPAAEVQLPVDKIQPAYVQVATQLRRSIMGGALLPGDRLPTEPEIGALFGVSRSTVREALRMLSSQDLVQTTRGVNGGTFVVAADPRKLSEYLTASLGLLSGAAAISVDELLEVRELIEVPAVRLAARKRTAENLADLTCCVERESALSDRAAEFEPHRQFHSLLLASAQNRLLPITTDPLFEVLRTRFLRPAAPARFWAKTAREHAEILERVRDKDEDGAAELMRMHLKRLRATYSLIDVSATGNGRAAGAAGQPEA